jgi:phosphatidylethanolamine-binding protein (PEBP) family uncharacterized protein
MCQRRERIGSCSSIASAESSWQVHHYVLTHHALTIPQVAGQALTSEQLIQAISGHMASATVIIGTFVRG